MVLPLPHSLSFCFTIDSFSPFLTYYLIFNGIRTVGYVFRVPNTLKAPLITYHLFAMFSTSISALHFALLVVVLQTLTVVSVLPTSIATAKTITGTPATNTSTRTITMNAGAQPQRGRASGTNRNNNNNRGNRNITPPNNTTTSR